MPSSDRPRFVAHVRKEALKFSSAHMTVFADGTKEALHGHNYQTEVRVALPGATLAQLVPFSTIKQAMKRICDDWDEHVLLAANCPFMSIRTRSDTELEFVLCGKRYVLPSDEVVLLPVDNIIAETLAEQFAARLVEELAPLLADQPLESLEVRIEEIPGQGATYFWSRRV